MPKKFKIEDHFRDYNNHWEFPIPYDFGKDIVLKNKYEKDVICYPSYDKDGYRNVELYITSWLGSIGAIHYYGRIKSYSLSFCETPEQIGKVSVSGAFTSGTEPKYGDFLNLELVRPVDERDLEHDKHYDRDRWLRCKIGDKTNGFWTEEEIVKLGTKLFKKMFVGKWRLYINSYSGKYDKYVKL
jgi:hypothetical protein